MANYNEFYKGISATDEYLVRFFKNLLLGESNPLSNREMHISNIKSLTPKSQNDTLNCTLEEMAVLQYLQSNPEAKQEDIAKHIGKSLSTLKKLPDGRLAQRLSPRRKKSHWTELNKRRCEALISNGLMTDAGLKAFESSV